MHKAQSYFDGIMSGLPPTSLPTSIVVNATHATNLQHNLLEDARDYLYSATVSVADAVQAIDRQFFSWAVVKLYYAAFYSLRVILAANRYAVVYHSRGAKGTPYLLECLNGRSPLKLSGNTHKVVLDQYSKIFPHSILLSQPIGLSDPFIWMMEKREEVNYKNPRFCEPREPQYFRNIVQLGIRRAIQSYIHDSSDMFTFDPDHAMVALPIKALSVAAGSLNKTHPTYRLASDDVEFLAGLFRDRFGAIKAAEQLFT